MPKIHNYKKKKTEKVEAEKEPKKPMDYVQNVLLFLLVIGFFVVSVSYINAKDSSDTSAVYMWLAMFSLIGVVAMPNIIRSAYLEQKKWKTESRFGRLLRAGDITKISDTDKYQKKLLHHVIRHALLNFGTLVLILLVGIIHRAWLITDPNIHFRMSRHEGWVGFVLLILLVGAPLMIAYNATHSILRIRTVLRKDYMVCRAHAIRYDSNELSIKSKKKVYYTFKYAVLVGLKKEEVRDKDVILVFVPSEVYVFANNQDDVAEEICRVRYGR